jgi:hypothetical protein
MSIPQKSRAHAHAPSGGARACSGVGPGQPGHHARPGGWPGIGVLVAVPLTIALSLGVVSCSDDADRIDQNYGTDVGAGFHLPQDASAKDAADAESPAPDAVVPTDPDAATGDAGVVAPDASQVEPADAAADGGDPIPG